jgi:hypothetical protein
VLTPEGKIKSEIKKHLKELGAYVFMPVQMGVGERTVDILACVDGRFVGIECKSRSGKLTDIQRLILKHIEEAGGIAIEARSWQDVSEKLGAQNERSLKGLRMADPTGL